MKRLLMSLVGLVACMTPKTYSAADASRNPPSSAWVSVGDNAVANTRSMVEDAVARTVWIKVGTPGSYEFHTLEHAEVDCVGRRYRAVERAPITRGEVGRVSKIPFDELRWIDSANMVDPKLVDTICALQHR